MEFLIIIFLIFGKLLYDFSREHNADNYARQKTGKPTTGFFSDMSIKNPGMLFVIIVLVILCILALFIHD